MKKYITISPAGSLVAPTDAPFALQLRAAGWLTIGKELRTQDFDAAMTFLEHFHPDLQRALANELTTKDTSADYKPVVPEGITLEPWQKEGAARIVEQERTLLFDEAGTGKGHRPNDVVLTPDGWRQVRHLSKGSEIYGRDGNKYHVQRLFTGRERFYRIGFVDGGKIEVTESHLWLVCDSNTIMRTGEQFQERTTEWLHKNQRGTKSIPYAAPIQHEPKDFPIDPYTLGQLIADGYMCGTRVEISACDPAHMAKIRVPAHTAMCRRAAPGHYKYVLRTEDGVPNCLMTRIREMGLNVKGMYKFIPAQYFFGAPSQRLELLRGLMDGDGTIQVKESGSVSCIYSTGSERLAQDVRQLVMSLGGRAEVNEYKRHGRNKEFVVSVSMMDVNPMTPNTQKGDKFRTPVRHRERKRDISYVEQMDEGDYICLSVDSPDQTYVARDYIVTHNTPTIIAAMNDIAPRTCLIVCPATLKYNWKSEMLLFTTISDILTSDALGVVEGDFWPDTPYTIINYDILGRHLERIYERTWDMLVCDEAHKLKYETSNRTVYLLGGVAKDGETYPGVSAKKEVYASATPMDRPEQLWPMIKRTDPKGLGADFMKFAKRYCNASNNTFGLDTRGASNLEELGALLRASVMVRHDPNVLELPPLVEQTILFPSSVADSHEENLFKENMDALLLLADEQQVKLSENPTTEEFRRLVGNTFLEQGSIMKRPEFAPLFHQMATVRRELGEAKIPLITSYCKDQLDSFESLAMFAYHTVVLNQVADSLPNCGVIKGGMTAKKKDEVKRAFQEGELTCLVGQISAAGEGITLTRSQKQVFGELDWNYTAMRQAKKRLHRYGQKRTVYVDYLLVDETMDAATGKSVIRKGRANSKLFAE